MNALDHSLPRLKRELRVVVIYNGDSGEPGAVIRPTYNPRSSKSYRPVAEDIAAALRAQGFRHVVTLPDDMRLGEALQRERIDFAWINSAGVQGYNPACHTPATLEMLGVPYVGHNPLNAGTLDNKHVFKHGLQALGIPTAPFVVWDPTRGRFTHRDNVQFARVFGDHAGPFVVKPASGRGSQHVVLVKDRAGLDDKVEEIGAITRNTVLVETFLSGPEYAVAVCGPLTVRGGAIREGDGPTVFSAVERMLAADEPIFTSMDVKPITTDRARLLDPVADGPALDGLVALAQRIYVEFQLRTLVRLDVRSDANGMLHVLEANPKPDLKAPDGRQTNLVAIGLDRLGMDYPDLVLSLLMDRFAFYVRNRAASVPHLTALLD